MSTNLYMIGQSRYDASAEYLKMEERRERAAKNWAALDAIRPANATAVIIAELEEDTSDPMSDYYGSKTVRRVAIGWRTGKRESFKQLRRAASKYAPTAHLGPDADEREIGRVEHRDNYSMGHGNWVGIRQHSGWQVRSFDLSYAGYRSDPLVLWLPGLQPLSRLDK